MRPIRSLALVGLVALQATGCGLGAPSCDETLAIEDGRSVCVRVATGAEALRQGLRGAPRLGEGEGLLLRYPVVSEACITMEGVEQPLDAWFLGDDGRVLRAACGLAPGATEPVCQKGTKQVLETAPHPTCEAYEGRTLPTGTTGILRPVEPVPPEGEACAAPGDAPRIDGQLHLVVHRSELVSEDTVRRLLQRAQGYFAPYALWLVVDEVHTLPPAHRAEEGEHGGKASDALLTGTRLEVLEKLKAAGLPEEAETPEQQARVDAIVQDVVIGPYRTLVQRLAEDTGPARKGPSGRVHVVFLQHIARPGSLGEGLFQELRGLTVSPWLPSDDGAALGEVLALPEGHAPVTVVGVEPVDHLGPTAVDVTLAHELGHALGLPHVEGTDDLMQEGIPRCVPVLRPEQVGAMRGHERL